MTPVHALKLTDGRRVQAHEGPAAMMRALQARIDHFSKDLLNLKATLATGNNAQPVVMDSDSAMLARKPLLGYRYVVSSRC